MKKQRKETKQKEREKTQNKRKEQLKAKTINYIIHTEVQQCITV